MKTFEIFEEKKKGQNGRRKFKVILYRVFPDECIDTEKEVGTEYNINGITWIRQYCEKALDSIKGMFLRCEFTDDERTEISGHGMTDIVDDVPVFENATTIGTFTDGYIDEIEDENGERITVCIGVGEIDSSCYHNFCTKLDEDIANGIYPKGSVEIMRTEGNEGIVYLYGYKDKGRIPTEFIHSGYALLGVAPSDNTAQLVELNENKEETPKMSVDEMKALIETTVSTYTNQIAEINQCKSDCEAKIAELNQMVEKITCEKNEIEATSAQIQEALDQCRADMKKKDEEMSSLWEEKRALEIALGEAKAKERLGELNAAIAGFTDEEKAYAQSEIEAFNAAPVDTEINSVVDKILIGIGKKAKEKAADVTAEQNSAKVDVEDIFGMVDDKAADEDMNIFE